MTNPTATNSGPGESVVDEVRAIRAKTDAEAGHDIRKLAEQTRWVSEAIRGMGDKVCVPRGIRMAEGIQEV